MCRKNDLAHRRAELMVQCARDILGLSEVPGVLELKLELSVAGFQQELERRYGVPYPDLVYRTESTLERARLVRDPNWSLPKVILRQGAPAGRRLGGGGLRRLHAAAVEDGGSKSLGSSQ